MSMSKMMDLSKCPDCGSSDIVDDTHYSQSQLVCASCGFILTEGLLTTTQAEEGFSQAVRYSASTGENDGISRYKLRGIMRVRTLCKALRLPNAFEDTAVSYFERAFHHPTFHQAPLPKKEIIVGCCVYITCRQHTWPLTMATICSLLYANWTMFASTYRHLINVLGLDVPAFNLTEMVKAHCKSFRLFQPNSGVPAQFSENMDKVVERTLLIVEVASDTWLVTGRHPIPIITAAAYLAWQSLHPASRLMCPFRKFCALAEIDQPPPSPPRLKELYSVLTRLGLQLPWLKMLPINAKTVVQNLGDILRHRNFLLKQSLEVDTGKLGLENDSCPDYVENMSLETQGPSEDLARNVGKRVKSHKSLVKRPFLPPCLENPSKRLLTQPLSEGQVVTGDEEISDNEIEQCLRTEEEMTAYCKANPEWF
ncbi:transcription factor IIIB 50 kDa subunit [Ambystoma mexicanum]|uniref:transcription factor IIIB 50 kDa subunit n=1 Tax=Ambystoma mexicanum TaxID=8296 RepID=UPI0037E92D18